ncbi:MAG: HD domain-containing protein [Synergistaceae bacterium]|nr:HD domain-containing protein [Synergistaceae bacterium]
MKHKILNVAVGELPDCYGVVAEDVFGKNGAIILPAGIALLSLRETRPEIVSNLLRHGITHVKVKNQPEITSGEFRDALGKVAPRINQFNPLLAQLTIHQFAAIYRNIDDKFLRERGINSLLGFSSKIHPELSKTSQITLSMVTENAANDWAHSHSLNVALLSGFLAQKLFPMWTEFAENVILGGLFHDIGKAFLPDSMRKTEELNPSELRILNCHPLLGESLLKDVGVFSGDILGAVRSHHEKWDGTGTPDNLNKEAIPISARIVAVANAFENFAAKCDDVDKRRCDQALTSVIGVTQTNFDKKVVRTLLASIGLYPPGSVVKLSDDRLGVVLETKERNLVCPRVMVFTDEKGRRAAKLEILNIAREAGVFIKDVFDDFSKRELDSYIPEETPKKILARVRAV